VAGQFQCCWQVSPITASGYGPDALEHGFARANRPLQRITFCAQRRIVREYLCEGWLSEKERTRQEVEWLIRQYSPQVSNSEHDKASTTLWYAEVTRIQDILSRDISQPSE
jgi:hypothetical protein